MQLASTVAIDGRSEADELKRSLICHFWNRQPHRAQMENSDPSSRISAAASAIHGSMLKPMPHGDGGRGSNARMTIRSYATSRQPREQEHCVIPVLYYFFAAFKSIRTGVQYTCYIYIYIMYKYI